MALVKQIRHLAGWTQFGSRDKSQPKACLTQFLQGLAKERQRLRHGTDFVADSLEKATVDAIQREAFLAMDSLARRFGEPTSLPGRAIEYVRQHEHTAEDWWWYYAGEVGAPRRSAAGL